MRFFTATRRPGALIALICLVVCGFLAASRSVGADVFYLNNGGQVEGDLLNPEQSPREHFVVGTELGRIVLPVATVKRYLPKSAEEKRYEALLERMPDTVEGHWIMAEQCREMRLREFRRYHLEEVLKRDPDHAPARHGLGYSRHGEEWILPDVWHRENGYVKYKTQWVLPQEKWLAEQAEAAEKQEKDWYKQIKTWKSWIEKGRGKEAEALQNIQAIKDPMAAPAIAGMLKSDKEPPVIRRILIDALHDLPSGAATGAMVDAALHDDDRAIRERALDYLEKFARASAKAAFLNGLKSKENLTVQRSAVGLGRLKEPDTIPELIEALITEHKVRVGSGGGNMNPVFSSNPQGGGLGGLNMGKKPQYVMVPVKNQAVRDALAALSGINLEYDKERWTQWHVQTRTPVAVDLRRRP